MIDDIVTHWRLVLIGALIATAAFGLGYISAKNDQRTPIIIEKNSP